MESVEDLLYFLSDPVLYFLIYLDFPGSILLGRMFGVYFMILY